MRRLLVSYLHRIHFFLSSYWYLYIVRFQIFFSVNKRASFIRRYFSDCFILRSYLSYSQIGPITLSFATVQWSLLQTGAGSGAWTALLGRRFISWLKYHREPQRDRVKILKQCHPTFIIGLVLVRFLVPILTWKLLSSLYWNHKIEFRDF